MLPLELPLELDEALLIAAVDVVLDEELDCDAVLVWLCSAISTASTWLASWVSAAWVPLTLVEVSVELVELVVELDEDDASVPDPLLGSNS